MPQIPPRVTCCVVGGGPAGVMHGVLLARAGIEVAVLEKHGDFLRDFRGDTIHPSTLQLLHELGWLDAFLRRPHQELRTLTGVIGDTAIQMADFSHLPTQCRFVALMPQWDFLDFLAEAGRHYPGFHLCMETEAADLIEEDDRIVGVRVQSAQGPGEIRADLVVAADGRHSTLRRRAGLTVIDIGAPIDVLWMRLTRHPGDPPQTAGRINFGRMLVTLNRGDYWQCAYVIRKGGYDQVRARGLDALRQEILRLAPYFHDRVGELKHWDDVKLLTVAVDRLEQWWRPGLLCIGDSAHAMSPIGGVGINLAIQDAVAAANILAEPLRRGTVTGKTLAQVQRRRTFPMRVIQGMQVLIQQRVLDRVLGDDRPIKPPLILRLYRKFPFLSRLPARLVGLGVRPEHIRTPELPAAAAVQQAVARS